MVGATSTRKKQYTCIDFDLFQYHKTVSTVALSPLFSLPSGQGLEMCGPHRRIQQAVGTVATNIAVATGTVGPDGFQYRKQ